MARKSLLERIALFGRAGLGIVETLGRSLIFLWHALVGRGGAGTGMHLLVKQLYSVGVLSLAIIIVSGLFIGMVLALQGYSILVDFGSEQAVGQMVALTLLRELGPVVTALLFAGWFYLHATAGRDFLCRWHLGWSDGGGGLAGRV